MARKLVKWLVAGLGVLLVISGVAALWNGWGIIQVERGWSLFIGGAAAVSGGAVVLALVVVIDRLDAIVDATRRAAVNAMSSSFRLEGQGEVADPPRLEPDQPPSPAFASGDEPVSRDGSAAEQAEVPPPQEVDRYKSGDTTYIMFSDGSVEVRSGGTSRRFESLARLREEAAQRY